MHCTRSQSRASAELLRREPVAALLSKRHRLADAQSISLGELREETLLLFPRQLSPAYYDRIVAACEQAGFQPRIHAFQDPPVNAMLARLPGGREVGLTPASFAFHAAEAEPGIVAREIVDPAIVTELSILWSASAPSAAIAPFLASARRCATGNGWLHAPNGKAAPTSSAVNDAANRFTEARRRLTATPAAPAQPDSLAIYEGAGSPKIAARPLAGTNLCSHTAWCCVNGEIDRRSFRPEAATGNHRLRPALCGDSPAGRARDRWKPAVVCA